MQQCFVIFDVLIMLHLAMSDMVEQQADASVAVRPKRSSGTAVCQSTNSAGKGK